MLEFSNIELNDRYMLEPVLRAERDRGCEYTFGNLYIWQSVYNTRLALNGKMAVIRFDSVSEGYLFPIGTGDLKSTVELMMSDSESLGRPFHIIAASKSDCDELERLFPSEFSFHPVRDYGEYVYNTVDLADLAGRKYHQKRNHISRFEKENPDYCFEKLDSGNIAEAAAMNERWYAENIANGADDGLSLEHEAVKRALAEYDRLGFSGGMIKLSDGRVAAFSLGEPINDNTFCVHIEKAFSEINGSYTVINREFVRAFCGDYAFVNREDDVGDEGLRKAKLSYYPVEITEKYSVRRKKEQ